MTFATPSPLTCLKTSSDGLSEMSTPTFDVPDAAYIRLDLFPALIEGEGSNLPGNPPGNVWDARRVVVTDSYLHVFSDSPTGPVLTYSGALVDFAGRNTIGWDVQTEDLTLKVKRSKGCGCGTRLRSIFPFMGVPFIAQQ